MRPEQLYELGPLSFHHSINSNQAVPRYRVASK